MKITESKTSVSLIALFLMLTIAVSIIALPMANAVTNTYTTWLYVGTSAGTRGIGVGETVLLVSWTAEMPPDIGERVGVVASPTSRAGWHGMQIKVWDPDNETQTLDMPYSDPVGANYISYTPTKVGTYQVQAIFPYTDKEHMVTATGFGAAAIGDHKIYSAAVSPIATFEVYAEATPKWPESPLPNNIWTRPISDAARDWSALAGNWLAGAANVWPLGSSGGNVGSYGYGQAPNSAHVLWSKPFFIGGLMDERFGSINYHTAHYQGVEFSPTVVLDGKIHWTPRYTTHGSKGWEIIDLYSGETLSTDFDAAKPNMGSIYEYESPNQHGGFAYLWRTGGGGGFFGGGGASVQPPEIVLVSNAKQSKAGVLPTRTANYQIVNRTATPVSLGTVWELVDAHTMNPICYIANVSTSGTQVYGKDGSILYYYLRNYGTSASPNYYVTVWNSSCGTMLASETGTGAWQWRPAGGDFGAEDPYFGAPFFSSFAMDYNIVHDGSQMYWANFSVPSPYNPRNSILNETGSIRAIRQDEYMVVGTAGQNTKDGIVQGFMMGISLERGTEGSQLWKTTFTPPFVDLDKNITMAGMFTGGFGLSGVYPEDGVFVFEEVKQNKRWVYDLYTGELLFEAVSPSQFDYYGMSDIVYQGLLIGYGSYSGKMTAWNITTGAEVWTYNAVNEGSESPYGNYPMIIGAIGDGKIYTYTSEHSYTMPMYRGPNLRCINATDGTEVFSILDFGGGLAIADGRLLTSNSMDNMIYCYGKGPSGTTVTASPKVSVHGTSVMIEGTVTDQTSTGRRNTNDLLDWTLKGTPAISDEDMSAWMEYKFMQQVYPADAKGVEVVLIVVDPNNNVYEIGRTTSDAEGNYGFAFEPEVPGTYQIIATFEGSNSYGPSSATSYLTVDEAPAATAVPTPPPASMTDTYVLGLGAGAIIAIIAIGIVIILMLRRR